MVLKVDPVVDKKIDTYFKQAKKLKKMLPKDEVEFVIKECINRPKGVVPECVYDLIPDLRF